DLTVAEGVPSEISQSVVSGRFGQRTTILQFKVSPFLTAYDSGDPNYEEVFRAVQSGEPIRIWVDAKKAAQLGGGEVPLYQFEHRGKTLVDFHQRAAQD